MKIVPIRMDLGVAVQKTPWKLERGHEELEGRKVCVWMISNSEDVPIMWVVSETSTPVEEQTVGMIMQIPDIFNVLGNIMLFASDHQSCPFCSVYPRGPDKCIMASVHTILSRAGCIGDIEQAPPHPSQVN